MWRFLRRRLLASLLTLFGITTITFALARVVPSDPAVVYIGPLARPDEIARVTKELGLDRPLYEQYLSYMGDLFRGDWGRSLASKEPVLGAIAATAPGHARADLPRDDARRGRRDPARGLRRLPQGWRARTWAPASARS